MNEQIHRFYHLPFLTPMQPIQSPPPDGSFRPKVPDDAIVTRIKSAAPQKLVPLKSSAFTRLLNRFVRWMRGTPPSVASTLHSSGKHVEESSALTQSPVALTKTRRIDIEQRKLEVAKDLRILGLRVLNSIPKYSEIVQRYWEEDGTPLCRPQIEAGKAMEKAKLYLKQSAIAGDLSALKILRDLHSQDIAESPELASTIWWDAGALSMESSYENALQSLDKKSNERPFDAGLRLQKGLLLSLQPTESEEFDHAKV